MSLWCMSLSHGPGKAETVECNEFAGSKVVVKVKDSGGKASAQSHCDPGPLWQYLSKDCEPKAYTQTSQEALQACELFLVCS
mmetsp:Transcript_45245/g.70939  ORF Transcript_45245/g.70939 Transcript_45245/m.70939 type:complete len:82 (+) Transcript_45245:341-586(+)